MLQQGETLPFDKIIACNIGNPQALRQKPITFNRQVCWLSAIANFNHISMKVLSIMNFPEVLNEAGIEERFPPDVIDRANTLLASIPSGIGAYSDSKGKSRTTVFFLLLILNNTGVGALRDTVSAFIENRDGHASDPENIFLTDGASPAVQMCMNAMLTNKKDAIMVPLPQYPLYSAGCALYGGSMVGYYLNESKGWSMERQELERSITAARADGLNVRALVVINPGNPTGNCLSLDNMKEVVQFCSDENLILLADEVYQENIWQDREPWQSFKRVVSDLDCDIELASFHSVSKGFLGECGRRGGYVEFCNFDPEVIDQLYKFASISLCRCVHQAIVKHIFFVF
jgi:alanine transaminase